MKRTIAALTFVGGYLSAGMSLYATALATQTPQSPSFLAVPLIGVAFAAVPVNVGLVIGMFLKKVDFSAPLCLAYGALPAFVAAAVATPIGRLASWEVVTNAVLLAMFVICLFLPRLAAR